MFGGGGFGSNTTFGQQSQQPQQTSTFGQPAQQTQQSTTGFGFGQQPAQQTSVFGQPQQQQQGSVFGQPQSAFGTNTTSAFGSNTSTFGAQNRPTFGTSGNVFGSNTTGTGTGTGFGGFGSTTATSGFGSTNTSGGGLFGTRPATTGFGSSTTPSTTSGGIFGGGQQTSTFGSTTGGFGSTGGVITDGTASVPFQAHQDKDTSSSATNLYQSITCMPAYRNYSVEELRMMDYAQGRKQPSSGVTGAFGQSTGFGGTSTFGQTSGGPFGSSTTGATGNTGLFGGGTTSTPGFSFGASSTTPATTSAFGQQASTTGGFGSTQPNSGGLFGGGTSSGFGQTNNTATGFSFGGQQNKPAGTAFGGFGSTTGTTGGFGSGTGFGNTTTSAGMGGFGATSTTTPSGAFGGTQTSSTMNSGGIFGQQPQQQSQQPLFGGTGTGAFGQSTTPASGTGMSFGFGGTAAKPATTGFGGFGSTQTTATGAKPGGLFGSTTTPAASSGTGLFGQPSTSAPGTGFGTTPLGATGGGVGGGLFGSTQPVAGTTTTGGGLFGGNTSTTNPFTPGTSTMGTAASGSGGLFGMKPATTNTTGLTTNLFGQPTTASTQSTSGGLFGTSSTVGSTGGGLFGTKPNTMTGGTSLFGQSQTSQVPSLFSQSQPLQSSFQQSQPQQLSQTLTASVGDNAYGYNPLFASTIGTQINGPSVPAAIPVSVPSRRKKAALLPHNRLTPRSSTNYRLRGFSPAAFEGRASTAPVGSTLPPPPGETSIHLFNGKSNEDAMIEAAFTPKSSVKKLVINRKIGDVDLARGQRVSATPDTTPARQILKTKVQFNPQLETLDRASSPAWDVFGRAHTSEPAIDTPTKKIANNVSNSFMGTPTTTMNGATSPTTSALARPMEKFKYWMSPTLSTLLAMDTRELKHVSDFTVGCNGLGHVHFDEPVDLTNLPCDIKDICGNVIIFGERTCTVYREDQEKPPVGKGLNVPATITLEGCFAFDKATRAPIKDESHPRYRQFLERIKNKRDTKFVDYEKEGGIWRFHVPHFTKYGLDESDDDTEMDGNVHRKVKTSKSSNTLQSLKGKASTKTDVGGDSIMHDVPPASSIFDEEDLSGSETAAGRSQERNIFIAHPDEDELISSKDPMLPGRNLLGGDRDRVPSVDENDTYDNMSVYSKSSRPWADKLGLESRRVQVMQASFFGHSSTPQRMSPRVGDGGLTTPQQRWGTPRRAIESLGKRTLNLRQTPPTAPVVTEVKSRAGFDSKLVATVESAPPAHKYNRVVFAKSLLHGREGNVVDAGLMLGHSFRASWGPGGILVHCGKICGLKEVNNSHDETLSSKIRITKIRMFAEPNDVERKKTEMLLACQLSHTMFGMEYGVPKAVLSEDIQFKHFLPLLQDNKHLFAKEVDFWTLAHVIFDGIDIALDVEASDVQVERAEQLIRRNQLSDWFHAVSEEAVKKALKQPGLSSLQQAFIHLTGRNIEKAAELAASEKNYKLSLLICQTGNGGDLQFRKDLKNQIEKWRKYHHGNLISIEMRKIYEVLSGNLSISNSDGIGSEADHVIHLTDGLDWKRTFGMWLWFNSFEDWPNTRTVVQYESAMKGSDRISKPVPWYLEDNECVDGMQAWMNQSSRSDIYDAAFELLKVMESEEYAFERALTPRGFGPSPLNYRYAWQFYVILYTSGVRDFARIECGDDEESGGYSPAANMVHANMAAQLEYLGLWEWAVFVLLHMEIPEAREKGIKDTLERNMPLLSDDEEWKVTKRLIGEWHIPESWVYSAKALRARYLQKPYEESKAWFLAGEQNKAHRITVTQLAPNAVLAENIGLLKRLFDSMDPEEVEGWHHGGQIFRDFVEICDKAPKEIEKHRVGASAIPSPELYSVKLSMQKFLRTLPLLSQQSINSGSQTRNLRLDVCIAEMSAKVSVWLQQMEAWYDENDFVGNLPLPEDQRLIRIQAVAHSYLSNLLMA